MGKLKSIVIVGAGFGGLEAVKKLSENKNLKITLIDRQNHHLFQPLLYQVATAELSPADIAIPARALTAKMKNVSVVMADVMEVDKENRIIHFDETLLYYDYLILAMGARTGYFGNENWEKHTIGLKNIKDALEIRRRLLLSFEQAEIHPERSEELLNFIIVGGGPTGVELAGAIAELAHDIIKNEFRKIDPAKSKITLIEAGPKLVPSFSDELCEYTKKQLEKRGVHVLLNTKVGDIDKEGVHTGNTLLKGNMIIWAAGVEANPFTEKLGVKTDRQKRVLVNQFCSLEEHPEIFVIGDMAAFSDQKTGMPLPGVSSVAMQQGRYVAGIIKTEIDGKQRVSFQYKDKGNMATIGRKDAIAEIKSFKLKGIIGWLTWLFVHLYYVVGFKNRVSTLITWMWSYITLGAGARVIQEPVTTEEKNKRPMSLQH